MDRPPGSRLEKVLADFAEQHGVLDRAREQMRALSVTTPSKDGAVEVTVGADGRPAGIRFVGRQFREMAAPQLSDSVMEALATARAEVAARVTTVLLAANFRLSAAVEGVSEDELFMPEAISEAPSVCWRRLVQVARVAAAGPAPVRKSGWERAGGTVGPWAPGAQEAATAPDTARARPQGPLWGRPGARPVSSHTPLPAELHDAVMALRDAVCDAVCDS
ncbi:YbaB/EbfC family nucleoid-associated protein [Streptomyces sp. NPDC088560]|uniref:YbaB/EbfC family nucleoid-associated protein n=1 Tax=Streptomyces sp. NPDC088560 TaxID=3365868 RepID=UPI003801FDF1